MLYRLGRLDLMDMFPIRQYLYVFELQGSHFNVDSLIKLYDNWQQKLNSNNDKKNAHLEHPQDWRQKRSRSHHQQARPPPGSLHGINSSIRV